MEEDLECPAEECGLIFVFRGCRVKFWRTLIRFATSRPLVVVGVVGWESGQGRCPELLWGAGWWWGQEQGQAPGQPSLGWLEGCAWFPSDGGGVFGLGGESGGVMQAVRVRQASGITIPPLGLQSRQASWCQ